MVNLRSDERLKGHDSVSMRHCARKQAGRRLDSAQRRHAVEGEEAISLKKKKV